MIDHLRHRGLGVDPVCRVLELSPSTYFARKKRPKSARRLRDEQLMPLIEEVQAESGSETRPGNLDRLPGLRAGGRCMIMARRQASALPSQAVTQRALWQRLRPCHHDQPQRHFLEWIWGVSMVPGSAWGESTAGRNKIPKELKDLSAQVRSRCNGINAAQRHPADTFITYVPRSSASTMPGSEPPSRRAAT
ncbi:hypothetical protein [Streptomyces sp. NPDC006996]|uniref:hypothetical protein n=1 Tax=Streptomyces sp. NPDC006996 TaxID=3156908 RepID=UPI0033E1C3F6